MTEYKKREMQLHENDPTIDRKLDTLELKIHRLVITCQSLEKRKYVLKCLITLDVTIIS